MECDNLIKTSCHFVIIRGICPQNSNMSRGTVIVNQETVMERSLISHYIVINICDQTWDLVT